MSCIVLIAANLRLIKIADNLFSVLSFFVLLTKGKTLTLFHTFSLSLDLISLLRTYVP